MCELWQLDSRLIDQNRLKPTPEKTPNQLKLVDAELDGSSLIEAGIRFGLF